MSLFYTKQALKYYLFTFCFQLLICKYCNYKLKTISVIVETGVEKRHFLFSFVTFGFI